LLINELVTNSHKHAFPDNRTGEVIVEIRQITPQQARLRVTDNGVGFPPGVDMTRLETLGFQLVADLTRQLRGECRLENSRGAAVEIVFPLSVES
jgi:two-component sensor histidine kinase